jgi:hypothetical protein
VTHPTQDHIRASDGNRGDRAFAGLPTHGISKGDPSTPRASGTLSTVVSIEDLLALLVETLDDELEQLAVLRFRFVVLASLVAADQSLWLPMSVHELQQATEQLRLIDLRRAATTIGVTDSCRLDPETGLHELADRMDDNWGELLHDRREELLEQLGDLQNVAELTISALSRRSALVQEALAFVSKGGGATCGGSPMSLAPMVQRAI